MLGLLQGSPPGRALTLQDLVERAKEKGVVNSVIMLNISITLLCHLQIGKIYRIYLPVRLVPSACCQASFPGSTSGRYRLSLLLVFSNAPPSRTLTWQDLVENSKQKQYKSVIRG